MTTCLCVNNACGSCSCAKSKGFCNIDCHVKKGWRNVPCLNTEEGVKVKAMRIKDVRTALCANSLSPIGDQAELRKRLAVFFYDQKAEVPCSSKTSITTLPSSSPSASKLLSNEKVVQELFKEIINNEGESAYIMSLSGKNITSSSSKPDLRRAYLALSAKVHPDKNGGIQEASQAFQILLSAYERLANPENFLDKDEEGPARKRQKTERFTRSNEGCYKTKICCPQCKQVWGTADLGLEDAAYNFFMMGIKEYICGRCSCEFGCMTGIHYCPRCSKVFEYDPEDYHRKIKCGNAKCVKEFGFWMFKVSERRETEVKREAKKRHEEIMKKISQKKRRAARAGNRKDTDNSHQQKLQERLFMIGLRDTCPRCGWEITQGEGTEEAREHLADCNDNEKMVTYQKQLANKKEQALLKEKKKSSQTDVMALKQWEQNGRQVGQLWMLSENILRKECTQYGLSTEGQRHELISRLAKCIRLRERKMITAGSSKEITGYDTTGVTHVDDEDLPTNINTLERDELRDLCASYNIAFDDKDVKLDLIRKFESARFKGKGQLMILDKQEQEKDEESGEEYELPKDVSNES